MVVSNDNNYTMISGVGRILTMRGLKYTARKARARNFDHANLITSRAAPHGIAHVHLYVRTYIWPYVHGMARRDRTRNYIHVTYIARAAEVQCEEGRGAAVRLIAGWSLS